MKKSLAIAVGVVVAAGALVTGGAWYTGTQLESALPGVVDAANQEFVKGLEGTGSKVTLEMVSFNRHLFSSTAHYRLQVQSPSFNDGQSVELLFVDHIEHGPLPVSRVKSLALLPVMLRNNLALESNPLSEKWFAATHDAAPAQGRVDVGYDRAVKGTLTLLPVELSLQDQTRIKFSGLKAEVTTSAGADKVQVSASMDSLHVSAVDPADGQTIIDLQGLTYSADQYKGVADIYLGQRTLKLNNVQAQLPAALPVVLKDLVENDSSQATGNLLSASMGLQVGTVTLGGKDIGSAHMTVSAHNLDAPALQSLVQLYQQKTAAQQQVAAAATAKGNDDKSSSGDSADDKTSSADQTDADTDADDSVTPGNSAELSMTPAQQLQLQADLNTLLAAQPQFSLDSLSLKTANGESTFNLAVGLKAPTSFKLPADELVRQIVARLDTNLSVSELMVKDVAKLQAQMGGETDEAVLVQQSEIMGAAITSVTVGRGVAVQKGDNILSSLHYADGTVDFNGTKMPLQDFMQLVMSKVSQ